MSKYLTASKVGLLALLSLYTEGDILPSASIAVLSFIVSRLLHVNGRTQHKSQADTNLNAAIGIEVFEKSLIVHQSRIPGRKVWDLFLAKLWAIDSLSALHSFFESLTKLLPKTREQHLVDVENGVEEETGGMHLARNSPLGMFVRRTHLEFTRLQEPAIVKLWKNFVIFRKPTLAEWRKRNPASGRSSVDVNLNAKGGERIYSILYGDLDDGSYSNIDTSTDDVERLLEFQVDQMSRVGQRLPVEMKHQYEKMLQAGLAIPNLSHYVKFLDAWREGDYTSAFDNLHRYFDYTMHSREKTFYQHALLNLALLHADFECFSEAIAAMHESIATARENKEMACLNFSLSWLYSFGKAHPEELDEVQKSGVIGTDKEGLSFLKAKAKESNQWNLLSISLLNEAKLAMLNGDGLSTVFENLTKASHLNTMKGLADETGVQMSVELSLYARLGISHLASSKIEMFEALYQKTSTLENKLLFVVLKAHSLAMKGRYEPALGVMNKVGPETLRPLRQQQYWTAHMRLLKAERALHKDNLQASEHYLSQLQANPPPDHDVAFHITVLAINHQLRAGDYSQAMKVLEKQLARITSYEIDIYQTVKLMILKARIWITARTPQKGFSVAMRACSLAHRSRILPLLWEAVTALCAILNSLHEFDAVVTLAQSIAPRVLECADCELAARTFAVLADAHMGIAGREKGLKRNEQMTKCAGWLERAEVEWARVGNTSGECECVAKRALIMKLSGDLMLANDMGSRYLDIKRRAEEEGFK